MTRPERPEACPIVIEWVEAHVPEASVMSSVLATIRSLQGDVPPEVQAWADATERWLQDIEAWRKEQPVDVDLSTGNWRMFGGEWLGYWRTLLDVVEAAVRSCPERAKELAELVYQRARVHRELTERMEALMREMRGRPTP